VASAARLPGAGIDLRDDVALVQLRVEVGVEFWATGPETLRSRPASFTTALSDAGGTTDIDGSGQ